MKLITTNGGGNMIKLLGAVLLICLSSSTSGWGTSTQQDPSGGSYDDPPVSMTRVIRESLPHCGLIACTLHALNTPHISGGFLIASTASFGAAQAYRAMRAYQHEQESAVRTNTGAIVKLDPCPDPSTYLFNSSIFLAGGTLLSLALKFGRSANETAPIIVGGVIIGYTLGSLFNMLGKENVFGNDSGY